MDSNNTINSTRDIVQILPLIGHGVFAPLIDSTFDKGCKYYAIEAAINDLLVYKNNNKDPNSLNSIKTPTLQVSAEWRNSGDSSAFQKIEDQVVSFRRSILQTMIDAKKCEKAYYWDTYLRPEKLEALCALKQEALKVELGNQYGRVDDTLIPSTIKKDCETIRIKGIVAVRKALDLAYSRSLARTEKVRAKRTKKAEADVQMTGTSGEVNEKTLEKHVASILRRQEQSRRDKKASNVKGNTLSHCLSLRELTIPHRKGQKELWEEEVSSSKRLHFKRKIIEEASQILGTAPKRLKVGRIGDYPDEFFASSLEARVLFIRTKMSLSTIRTLRYLNFDVHKARNVILPRNIEYFLAVNLKHIFPQKIAPSLGFDAFESAITRLRTWFHFRDTELTGNRLDPYLASVVDRKPVNAEFTAHYESGILAGRNLLISVMSKVVPPRNVPQEPNPALSELGCTLRGLKEFMLLNHYMAFITDKNLGIAVVERDWYLDEVHKHLSLPCYSLVQNVPWDDISEGYEELLQSENLIGPEAVFLANPDNRELVPRFHAIPKIHKNPWKIRPIVPMHSYFTTRLAMWIHLYLHPLQRLYPWICTSSRDFVRDLLTETEGKKRTWKMFTGDGNYEEKRFFI
ncbi:reverse transcriptase [Fusarium heterosporum]|uniref:Reverse transcriptase n=1 Tax=Fusarium heterosporum TaxID=42747 RepID=A0A8H5WCA3_FUSHE|nr:reverse transcriptase [Fusarium heterosporum]